MASDERLANIPRGDTCAGVNRAIIEHLLSNYAADSTVWLLDIPCGQGTFLDALHSFFPHWDLHGADLDPPAGENYSQIDASKEISFKENTKFNTVTCISGVMEFDNTLTFFKNVKGSLHAEGSLIVTNDNILTVRDRLLYLFAGRFAQYPFSTSSEQPTWKIIPLHNLIRILVDAGFEIGNVEYVPVRRADWLWAPLALVLCIFGRIFSSSDPNQGKTLLLRSYLSRHYLLFCRPTASEVQKA